MKRQQDGEANRQRHREREKETKRQKEKASERDGQDEETKQTDKTKRRRPCSGRQYLKAPVQDEDYVAEDEAQQDQTQEVIPKELHV